MKVLVPLDHERDMVHFNDKKVGHPLLTFSRALTAVYRSKSNAVVYRRRRSGTARIPLQEKRNQPWPLVE